MASVDLVTLAEVRAALELPAAETSRDSLISSLITAYSTAIMDEVDREFRPVTGSVGTPTTRRFRMPFAEYRLDLAPYDLASISSVTLHPESTSPITLTPTVQYQGQPVSQPDGVYTSIKFSSLMTGIFTSQTALNFSYVLIDVSGVWGFPSVPEAVKQAAIIAVSSALRRDIAGFDMAFEDGSPTSLRPDTAGTFGLPPATRRLLSPYRRAVAY
jgi:hypothetical protein